MLDDDLLTPLWTLLDSPDFQNGVEKLGGYSCAETGRRIV
jgi:putative molybdopterin biosynthesis protein